MPGADPSYPLMAPADHLGHPSQALVDLWPRGQHCPKQRLSPCWPRPCLRFRHPVQRCGSGRGPSCMAWTGSTSFRTNWCSGDSSLGTTGPFFCGLFINFNLPPLTNLPTLLGLRDKAVFKIHEALHLPSSQERALVRACPLPHCTGASGSAKQTPSLTFQIILQSTVLGCFSGKKKISML